MQSFPLVSPMITSGALKALTHWPSFKLELRDFYFTYRKVHKASSRIMMHQWLKVITRDLEAEFATLGI